MCPLVTASDGGGSIRIPASFIGAFGLKPSYGRVPRGPLAHWDYHDTSVSGPLTKTVADAALLLDLTAGPSPWDPNTLPPPGLSYAAALAEPLPPLRIGFSPDLGYAVVQSDVAAAVEDAAQVFEKLGHRLVPIAGRSARARAASGASSAPSSSPPHSTSSCPSARPSSAAASRRDQAGGEMTRELGARSAKRVALNGWCAELFEHFDFLVTPTVPYDPPPAKGPFPRETEGRRQRPAGVAAFTIPFNFSWHPAATVRAGLSRRGLPVGHPDRGAAPPRRPRAARRARLRARAAVASRTGRPRWEKPMASEMEIHGACDPRFARVREVSRRTSASATRSARPSRSRSTGELVVDLWAGHADPARTRPGSATRS